MPSSATLTFIYFRLEEMKRKTSIHFLLRQQHLIPNWDDSIIDFNLLIT